MAKRVLVTGASKGIGKGIAIDLAKNGFEICVHFNKDKDGALDTVNTIVSAGGTAKAISFDVSDTKMCSEVLGQEIEDHGAFYGIVSNAGMVRDGAFPALSDDDWFDVINTDLNGFYNVVKPAIMPMIHLRAGGRIVCIGSVSGIIGNRGQVNYSAAKAGLIGAVKALAVELGKRRITVNCVAPGLIDTQMAQMEDFVLNKVLEQIPLGRMGKVEEVSSLVSFLFKDEAEYITRQVLTINGGMF